MNNKNHKINSLDRVYLLARIFLPICFFMLMGTEFAFGNYLSEIVLSKDRPVDERQPKSVAPIRLVDIDLQNRSCCIEIYYNNERTRHCAEEGQYFGDVNGILFKKLTSDSVVIHLYCGVPTVSYTDVTEWLPSKEIHLSAATGNLEKLKELTKVNPDKVNELDEFRMTPLMWAAYKGQKEAVELLVSLGATLDGVNRPVPVRFGQTPLHLAIKNGHKEIAKILLTYGANVNDVDIFGRTPCHYAVVNGDEDLVAFLIANGADVNRSDEDGQTPLHDASQVFNTNIVKLLCLHNALINSRDIEGKTPLHWASEMGREQIVKLLLAHDANSNAQDYFKSTPLHLAAENGHITVVKLLLLNGANVKLKNKDGMTASELAESNGYDITAKMLKRWEQGDKELSFADANSVTGLPDELHRRISEPIFGIYLGETLADIEKRFKIQFLRSSEDNVSQWFNVEQINNEIRFCIIELFKNKVVNFQVQFRDGSKKKYQELEKQLENKFGKPEIPPHFDYKRRYKACIDGINIEIIMQGRYGITVDVMYASPLT